MKTSRFFAILLTSAFLAMVSACSNPDSEQMKPGGAEEFGTSSSGSGFDLASGFGVDASSGFGADGSLSSRPDQSWTPIPGVELAPVLFAFDNYNVSSQQASKIEAAAKYMQSNPAVGIILEGHTDERGSAQYNIGLGERRALAVRDYLEKLGIASGRIQTVSYGLEKPADQGHDEQSWMNNRRVELIPASMN